MKSTSALSFFVSRLAGFGQFVDLCFERNNWFSVSICARFRIQAADLHGWFLFFSFLAFPLVSFGLWTANPMQVSDFFALITLGLDRATFVRSMSVCSTTSVAAESFCLWSPRSVHVVDLDRVFSGALRQQSRFLHGRFCIPHNSHGFCQVKVFLLEQFLL